MSHMTTESDDEILSGDQSGSSLAEEGGNRVGGSIILKKGPWTSAEDAILVDYVNEHGKGNWNSVQRYSGLFRCGKSCRLRWANHLRPNLKKGAFTPDEERLIIKLHAKMGNKWARMAAHLPGRTDNEIKNYWNTRIKRRQRAGLPLYPPEVCLHQMQESQITHIGSGAGGQNDHLQTNSFEIPDIVFNNLKETQGILPYIPEIRCVSTNTMLMNTVNRSDYYGFVPPIVHRAKRPRETAASIFGYPSQFKQQPLDDNYGNLTSQPFGSSFPYDLVSMAKSLSSFGENQGCHSLTNGKFSVSKPSLRTCKLELPSLQYPDTDFSSWGSFSPPAMYESVDAFIQSPPCSGALQSVYLSPKNSGLLDALLHEAKTRSSKSHQLSQKSLNSSALVTDDITNCSVLDMSEAKWEEYSDSISPLGCTGSIFKDCTPLSVSRSSLEEKPPAETLPGSKIKSEVGEEVWPMVEEEEDNETKLDYSRPDALLGSCWVGHGFSYEKDQVPNTGYISAPIHSDLGHDHKLMLETTARNQGCGFGPCAWNNMPAVCQISDLS